MSEFSLSFSEKLSPSVPEEENEEVRVSSHQPEGAMCRKHECNAW